MFLQIPIHYFPNEEDEIMHGLGVRKTPRNSSSLAMYDLDYLDVSSTGGCAVLMHGATQEEEV